MIYFQLTRGSPGDASRFHKPLGRDGLTQQIGLPSFLKLISTIALGCRPNYAELLIKLLTNEIFRNLNVWTKIGEKSYESTGAFLFLTK